MNIALIGYGKMGRMVERMALDLGHNISGYFSSAKWDLQAIQSADVCIEFTEPNSVLANVKRLAELKKNVVVGTTGWYHQLEEVQNHVLKNETALLYSPNFSLGVNIYLEILNHAAHLFNPFIEYDAAGIEYHHNQKKDSPSGTAQIMSDIIEQSMPRCKPLNFSSVRCGSIPGTHEMIFDSLSDTVKITHEARNRQGFAIGAIQAAEWLSNKRGIFTYSDCIKDFIKRRSA
jgi:4-hydroxy-tetrahydrodipicolinate reductase